MYTNAAIKLLDLALDLDEGKEDEVREILKNVRITLELGSVVASGIGLIVEAYKSPEKTEAERVEVLISLRAKLENYKAL